MHNEDDVAQLVNACSRLLASTKLAAINLPENFKGVVEPAILEAEAVLTRFEDATAEWEHGGKFKIEDCTVTYATTGYEERPQTSAAAIGVRIVHRPSSTGRESFSKATQAENYDVAFRSLKKALGVGQ